MRTTLNLDDALMRELKRYAAEKGTTMTETVEQAVRDLLAREKAPPEPHELRWVTVRGRLRPGIDLADRDSLLDAMEGRG